MEIRIVVFDGNISRCIARESFESVQEVNDFMDIVRQLDPKAKYTLTEIKK